MSNETTQHTPADVRERVLTVLTGIEWAAEDDYPDGRWYACCPWCGGGYPGDEETPPGRAGHEEMCELAAVLALLRTPSGDGEVAHAAQEYGEAVRVIQAALEVLEGALWINPSNYNHDDVVTFNDAAEEAHSILRGFVDRVTHRTDRSESDE